MVACLACYGCIQLDKVAMFFLPMSHANLIQLKIQARGPELSMMQFCTCVYTQLQSVHSYISNINYNNQIIKQLENHQFCIQCNNLHIIIYLNILVTIQYTYHRVLAFGLLKLQYLVKSAAGSSLVVQHYRSYTAIQLLTIEHAALQLSDWNNLPSTFLH